MKSPAKVEVLVPHDRSGRAARPYAASLWPKVRLGEIAECTLGKMLDHKKNHGIPQPYLANFNVRWGGFDLADVSMMPMEPEEFEKYELKRGDLVVCEGGEIGRCALWKEQVPGMKIQKALHRVRVKDGVDSTYLYYWFLNSGRSDFFKQFTTGATILHLPRQNLLEIPVPLPPLPIQRRIACVLGAYDDLIENNRRRIALLEKMTRELYRERFVRRVNGTGKMTLEQIAKFVRGKVIVKDATVPGDVPVVAGGMEPAYYHNVSNTGTPVITVSGSGANAGYARMYYENVWASDCSWVDAEGTPYIRFVYCFLKDNDAELRNAQKGAAQPHVHAKDVNVLMVSDDIDAIMSFEKLVTPMFDEIASLTLQNRNLSRQRDKLLPRLMSGKIDVEALAKEEK